ncbi:hypothetical protein ISS07_03085 [Candidatus Woesearchaeota archaeon]|nr:hypothetical protein [Candidatus Woesearchaeota archaeon]
MYKIKKHLESKGWKKSEINKTIKIIEHAKANKHPHIKFLDKTVYWFSLFIAVIGNTVIALTLIPFLLVLNGFYLYLIIVFLGVSFGLLFELLIRTLENLEKKHHAVLSILIPVIAIINIFIITSYANNLEEVINLNNKQNPYLVGLTYAASFMLPYITYNFFLRKNY